MTHYRTRLRRELLARQDRNSAYSLRAFARDLGLNPTSLSLVLAGKRRLARENALKVARALQLSPLETNTLLNQLGYAANAKIESLEFVHLEDDQFRVIADWYHYALLSLAKLKHNRAEPRWIAKRLGIPVAVAREAVQRLVRLDLVTVRGGRLYRTGLSVTTARDAPSASLRRFHKQMLGQAETALSTVPVEWRELGSTTLALDVSRLAEAKTRILAFRREMARLLETGHATQVYTLAVQLFPLGKFEVPHE